MMTRMYGDLKGTLEEFIVLLGCCSGSCEGEEGKGRVCLYTFEEKKKEEEEKGLG